MACMHFQFQRSNVQYTCACVCSVIHGYLRGAHTNSNGLAMLGTLHMTVDSVSVYLHCPCINVHVRFKLTYFNSISAKYTYMYMYTYNLRAPFEHVRRRYVSWSRTSRPLLDLPLGVHCSWTYTTDSQFWHL